MTPHKVERKQKSYKVIYEPKDWNSTELCVEGAEESSKYKIES